MLFHRKTHYFIIMFAAHRIFVGVCWQENKKQQKTKQILYRTNTTQITNIFDTTGGGEAGKWPVFCFVVLSAKFDKNVEGKWTINSALKGPSALYGWPCWALKGHTGPYRAEPGTGRCTPPPLQGPKGPYMALEGHMGPYRAIWRHMGPYVTM